jgi:clumping factor A
LPYPYRILLSVYFLVIALILHGDNGNYIELYDAAQNAAYEFVRINSESHFIVVLLPKVDDVPEGYNEVSLSIEGKGVATAYQTKAEKTDDQTKDFYLVYAMNDNGESGWYTYDSIDGTYMRTELSTPTVAQEENDTTKSELVPGIANKYLVLAAILVLIIIILALLLLVVIVKNKKRTANEENDEEDDTKEFDIVEDYIEENSDEENYEENDIEANDDDDDDQEPAEESQVNEILEPAKESGEESQIAEILESDENTESTEASDASYVGRTVEITSDLKKAAENKKSDFDSKEESKEASNQENAADDDTLKNQVQMALDGFVNDGNKPSETIDSSAKDDNEDDSEDDDLQFIDLN